MAIPFSLAQGGSLAQNFSLSRDSAVNATECVENAHKRFGTLLQFIEIPIDDPQGDSTKIIGQIELKFNSIYTSFSERIPNFLPYFSTKQP
jgi:hypothetical protein